VSPQVYARDGYLAGSEAQRAQALMEMFMAPDIDAIQVVHSGFGSSKIIPLLDFERIRQHPKPFIGRSDITALHAALARSVGLVTFYGPGLTDIAAPRGSEFSATAARRAVGSTQALGTLPVHPSDAFLVSIRGGRVTASLVGGCLWPLCKTIGTPWQPDLRGKVLFIEEVGEPPGASTLT
jgi:muramoyltetrapeptide carboxypeptidase